MATTKFSTLPFIDTNSQDVYETDDLAEEDQKVESSQTTDEPIEGFEQTSLNTQSAFERFKDTTLSSKQVDFSQGIAGKHQGYTIPDREFELNLEGKNETPQQKYQRLQCELRELTDDLSYIQTTINKEQSTEALSVPTGRQLEYLNHQLGELNIDDMIGSSDRTELTQEAAVQKRLMNQLDLYKPKPEGTKENLAAADSAFKCEFLYKPEKINFTQTTKLSELEERIERLESVIGHNTEKFNSITTTAHNKTLLGAVSDLDSKLNLLDTAQLQQFEAKLQIVSHKLGQITDKSKENTQYQSKIYELYDVAKKWESLADSLPHISGRLVAVKDLHEQALQLSRCISQLDAGQQQMTSSLTVQSDQLKQLQNEVSKNNEVVKASLSNLQSRIDALNK